MGEAGRLLGLVRVHRAGRNSLAGPPQLASAAVSLGQDLSGHGERILRQRARASLGKQTLMPLSSRKLTEHLSSVAYVRQDHHSQRVVQGGAGPTASSAGDQGLRG